MARRFAKKRIGTNDVIGLQVGVSMDSLVQSAIQPIVWPAQ
jgi:hypothetical protein